MVNRNGSYYHEQQDQLNGNNNNHHQHHHGESNNNKINKKLLRPTTSMISTRRISRGGGGSLKNNNNNNNRNRSPNSGSNGNGGGTTSMLFLLIGTLLVVVFVVTISTSHVLMRHLYDTELSLSSNNDRNIIGKALRQYHHDSVAITDDDDDDNDDDDRSVLRDDDNNNKPLDQQQHVIVDHDQQQRQQHNIGDSSSFLRALDEKRQLQQHSRMVGNNHDGGSDDDNNNERTTTTSDEEEYESLSSTTNTTTTSKKQKYVTHSDFVKLFPYNDPTIQADENPDPTEIDGHDTFSACMLVMDDNHRLSEWLAYHYHVLPLRYLIIAIDPRSETTPIPILNKWRKMGMYIMEWHDHQFWRTDLREIPNDAVLQIKRDRHRGRQKYFYRSCLIEMKENNRTWVTLHDSDEYLVYNHAGGSKYEGWEREMSIKHHKRNPHKKRITPSKVPPPTTGDEGMMIKYIRQEKRAGLEYFKSPCIGIPRLQFGTKESSKRQKYKDVPKRKLQQQQLSSNSQSHSHSIIGSATSSTSGYVINVNRFDTLRYRKHASRNDFVKNALGKVLIDVSRINMIKTPYFMSLHRPIKKLCKAPWHNDWNSGLRINHYLGSWDSYSFRVNDARRGNERSLEQWEFKNLLSQDETDDNIRPWIGGFINKHGEEISSELLKDVGLPNNYKPAIEMNDTVIWTLLPEVHSRIMNSNVSTKEDGSISTNNKQIQFDEWVRDKYKQQYQQQLKQRQKEEEEEEERDEDSDPENEGDGYHNDEEQNGDDEEEEEEAEDEFEEEGEEQSEESIRGETALA